MRRRKSPSDGRAAAGGDASPPLPGLWPSPAVAPPAAHIESDTSRKFSPSKLDTYRDCPRRYRYRYVDHLRREVASIEAYLGTCVHRALQKLYEGIGHGRKSSLAETLGTFEAEWDAGWSSDILIKNAAYTPENYRAVGRECVRCYYEAQQPFDRDKTVAVEKRLGYPLVCGGEQFRIEGFVDRLALAPDGTFEVHDYKTSGSLPSQEDLDQDWQLGIYDIAVRHNWPDARAVRLVWHFVRFGKDMASVRGSEQRQRLQEDVAALILSIKHDHEFVPRRSALCGWCEYREICPLWAHAERVKSLGPRQRHRDDGVKLVDEYVALEAKKRELREKLRELETDQLSIEEALVAFADRQGWQGVAGSEGEVVITEKEEYRFPTRAHAPEAYEGIERELKATALWKDVSRLDTHRLMEGYRRGEWDAPAMQALSEMLARHSSHIELVKKRILRFHRKEAEDS